MKLIPSVTKSILHLKHHNIPLLDFSHRPYFLNLVLILVIGYFSMLMVPLIILLVPDSIVSISPYGILLPLYFVFGISIYIYSKKIFKRISGEACSKILITSFFILVVFHFIIGFSNEIGSYLSSLLN